MRLPVTLALSLLTALAVGTAGTAAGCSSKSSTRPIGFGFQVTTTSLPNGDEGTPYSATVQTTGGTPPIDFFLLSGNLPQGLSLARTTGVISGTPTQAGEVQTFTLRVVESGGIALQPSFTITVNKNLTITTASPLPPGQIGSAYNETLQATGGNPPLQWFLDSGSLPAGLTLNSTTGAILGTPLITGTSSFTILVRDTQDAAGQVTDTATFQLTIN